MVQCDITCTLEKKFKSCAFNYGVPLRDAAHRENRPNGNYICCGPLIAIPHICVFQCDLPCVRIRMRLASYYSLGDFLRQLTFRGLWVQKRRFELDNSALVID